MSKKLIYGDTMEQLSKAVSKKYLLKNYINNHVILMGSSLYIIFCNMLRIDEELPANSDIKNGKWYGVSVIEDNVLPKNIFVIKNTIKTNNNDTI